MSFSFEIDPEEWARRPILGRDVTWNELVKILHREDVLEDPILKAQAKEKDIILAQYRRVAAAINRFFEALAEKTTPHCIGRKME